MMKLKIQCPLLNRIILRDHKNDNTYRIITSAGGFSVMFKCMGQAISDFNGQLILLSVFQLSSVYCIKKMSYGRTKVSPKKEIPVYSILHDIN